jgi:SAM-dependent methyltransferase
MLTVVEKRGPGRPPNPWKGKTGLKVNLGCGDKILDGYVNMDKYRKDESVIFVDLEEAKLPFDDDSVEEVWADNVFEHVQNFIPLMNEINRVLRSGGKLVAQVPFVPHVQAFQDPTHVRFFTESTFDYFIQREFLHDVVGKNYGIVPYRICIKQTNSFILIATLYK